MAIIGAITATAVHGDPVSKKRPEPVLLHFKNPPPPAPRPIDHTIRDVVPGPVIFQTPFHRVSLPQTISDHLPPIDSSFGRG
ncbi:MAG TPA: hypothetical protein VGH04_00930, partial [Gemmatimonadaceae bacterium]